MSVVRKIIFWTMRVMMKQKKVTKMRQNLEQVATNLMNKEKYGEEKVTNDFNSWSKVGLITVGLWFNRKLRKIKAKFCVLHTVFMLIYFL